MRVFVDITQEADLAKVKATIAGLVPELAWTGSGGKRRRSVIGRSNSIRGSADDPDFEELKRKITGAKISGVTNVRLG